MKNLVLFICLSFFLASCSFSSKDPSPLSKTETGSKAYLASLTPDERIELAKQRRSYITGIRKGDFYSLRNAPEEALSYYLYVQEKLPNDQVVRKKTANVYYVLKNWSRAYSEYIQVPLSELSEKEITELLNALFFDENTFDRLGELAKLRISSGSLEYYQMVDMCYTGIHNCIVNLESYSGSEMRIKDLKSQIKNAQIISPDYQYRNLLVAAKYYEQGSYRATEKIAREMLVERPDYMEVKKILWFALFELGKYEESKKYILDYLGMNPKDLDSIIRLGELYYHLGDYVSSNLYLNNAIIAGYLPKTNLERRLAYNYSMLDDTVGMMKVLGYLLKESDATEDDFAVGISAAIKEGQYSKAESWAAIGLKKYPDSNHITPLYIRALRLDGQIDNASALIQNTPETAQTENPSYLLEKALIFSDLGDKENAIKLLESLTLLTDWPEIAEEAKSELTRQKTP